jgi:hypothetical protein
MTKHIGAWSKCIRNLLLLALLATALLGAAEPAAAHTAPTPTPVSGTPVLVSGGSGNQFNPRISGTLVSYTNANDNEVTGETRYHDLATGVDAAIPTGGYRDSLPGVSGNNVVFRRVSLDDTTTRQIMLFDTNNPSGGPLSSIRTPASGAPFPPSGDAPSPGWSSHRTAAMRPMLWPTTSTRVRPCP